MRRFWVAWESFHKLVAVEIDIDSAPSDTDEDDQEVEAVKDLKVKDCTTDVAVKEGKGVVIATSDMMNKELESAMKNKMSKKKKDARELLGKRKREAQEEQAEKIMENGNDTIYKCYDELVFKLIGGKQIDDVLTSSPILKKK